MADYRNAAGGSWPLCVCGHERGEARRGRVLVLDALAFALAIPSMLCLFALPMPEPRPAE